MFGGEKRKRSKWRRRRKIDRVSARMRHHWQSSVGTRASEDTYKKQDAKRMYTEINSNEAGAGGGCGGSSSSQHQQVLWAICCNNNHTKKATTKTQKMKYKWSFVRWIEWWVHSIISLAIRKWYHRSQAVCAEGGREEKKKNDMRCNRRTGCFQLHVCVCEWSKNALPSSLQWVRGRLTQICIAAGDHRKLRSGRARSYRSELFLICVFLLFISFACRRFDKR